jgi:hypothetical protein
VAEQGCLLSSYPDKIGIGGSNPPLSAIAQRSGPGTFGLFLAVSIVVGGRVSTLIR